MESVVASLKASGLPALDDKWYYLGPFDNADGDGFDHAYPPEKEIDLTKTYDGKGEKAAWKEFKDFYLNPNTELQTRSKDAISVAIDSQIPCSYCSYLDQEFSKLDGLTENQRKEAVAMAIPRACSMTAKSIDVEGTAE